MFVPMEKQLLHNLYKHYCEHVCAHGKAATPQLVQPQLQLIRALAVGVPNYGKLDATNKA